MIKEVETNGVNPYLHRIEYYLDESVAYLEYSIIYDRMEIDNLYVTEEYRNRGIASALMEYLIDIFNKNNLVNITLEVRVSNDIAISLYKKYGFKEVSIRKYYYILQQYGNTNS